MRVLVYAVPLAGSIVFVRAATALTGVPTSSLWAFLAWWFALSLAATVVVSLAYSASRRLLPLGALLELSLVFPDEAPSRFRLALRSGTVAELEERLRRMRQRDEKVDVQEAAEILLQLVSALDVHDRITRGHAERVRAYAYSLGKQLDLTDRELDLLNWAALLHDIGKLSVSTAILNKPGRPTELEWAQLRLHPLHGEMLVEPIRGWLGEWTGAVGYHHERWDGTGYPRGIAGEEIPLGGRIVAIADVFDVITSTRSYKKSSTAAEARAEIARCSGEQFDPRLVRAFVEMSLGRMRMVVGPLSWLAHAPLLSRLPAIPSLGAALGGVTTPGGSRGKWVGEPAAAGAGGCTQCTVPGVLARPGVAAVGSHRRSENRADRENAPRAGCCSEGRDEAHHDSASSEDRDDRARNDHAVRPSFARRDAWNRADSHHSGSEPATRDFAQDSRSEATTHHVAASDDPDAPGGDSSAACAAGSSTRAGESGALLHRRGESDDPRGRRSPVEQLGIERLGRPCGRVQSERQLRDDCRQHGALRRATCCRG